MVTLGTNPAVPLKQYTSLRKGRTGRLVRWAARRRVLLEVRLRGRHVPRVWHVLLPGILRVLRRRAGRVVFRGGGHVLHVRGKRALGRARERLRRELLPLQELRARVPAARGHARERGGPHVAPPARVLGDGPAEERGERDEHWRARRLGRGGAGAGCVFRGGDSHMTHSIQTRARRA